MFKLEAGPMKAGKTKKLIEKVMQHKDDGKVAVFVLSHSFNDEEFVIVTSRSDEVPDIKAFNMVKDGSVSHLMYYSEQAVYYGLETYVFIDEIQFAPVERLELYKRLHEEYKFNVICFGLLEDYKQEVFPSVQWLLDNGVELNVLTADCEDCGEVATNNIRVTSESSLFVEDKEVYKTVCDKCLKVQHLNDVE